MAIADNHTAMEPAILVLDEPLQGLDPGRKRADEFVQKTPPVRDNHCLGNRI